MAVTFLHCGVCGKHAYESQGTEATRYIGEINGEQVYQFYHGECLEKV